MGCWVVLGLLEAVPGTWCETQQLVSWFSSATFGCGDLMRSGEQLDLTPGGVGHLEQERRKEFRRRKGRGDKQSIVGPRKY